MQSSGATSDEIFFVFVDTSNVACWHNLRFTKSITSSGFSAAHSDLKFREAYENGTAIYAPFVPNENRSSSFVSFFTVQAASEYEVEYDAEYLRCHQFPIAPSRLSAVFAFQSKDDCRKAHDLYKWDLGNLRKFRLIRDRFTRVHRANMEIVSLMRLVYPGAIWSREDRDSIWRQYWQGGGCLRVEIPVVRGDAFTRQWFECGEIWEYLVEGRLELVDDSPVSLV
jgi:hypothetical protein